MYTRTPLPVRCVIYNAECILQGRMSAAGSEAHTVAALVVQLQGALVVAEPFTPTLAHPSL
jgi:hypothetical protein